MKKQVEIFIELIMSFVIVITVFANMANADPVITIVPDSTNLYIGQEFKLKIMITGEDIINSAGWDGRIIFDPEYYSFRDVSEGDFNPAESVFVFNNPEPGKIIMIDLNMVLNTVNGQGIIAEVSLIPKRLGDSVIELQNFTFADPTSSRIPVILGSGLTVSTERNPADMDGDNDIDGNDLILFAEKYIKGDHPISLKAFAENYTTQYLLE